MSDFTDRFGLSAALTTPFNSNGAVDFPRLAAHARWCLDNGCSNVTAFGTTGEGASIGLSGREQVLGALAGGGLIGRDVVFCVAATSVHEALLQARLGYDFGARGILFPPPFYFKGVSDDGLFAWYRQVIEKLGAAARNIILYNIPSVTHVALSVDLIGRLRKAFPDVIIGVKDSSGDWPYTQQLLAAHKDIAILIGDERFLAEGIRRGGQGAISGLANVRPDLLRSMIDHGQDDVRINSLVDEVLKYPVTPAVKALVAHRTGDDTWLNVRAPLLPTPVAARAELYAAFDRIFAAKAA